MPSTKQPSNGKVKEHAVPGKSSTKPAPGARLAAAFESVERFPVLAESQARVMRAATAETSRTGDLIDAVEADVALTIAVLRAANRGGSLPGGAASIPEALEVLKPAGVLAIAGTAGIFDFFEVNGSRDLRPERFRVHALATQHVGDVAGRAVGWPDRDELAVASLLHDVGRLVIQSLNPGQQPFFDATGRSPEQRLREERDQLGIDHALVGGVLARRWNIPQRIAVAIERHHADDAEGLAGMVALADMVAHYSQGEAVSAERLRAVADRCSLDSESLRQLLYELPYPRQNGSRVSEPCPLSARELDVLRHLSEGLVYKQIAGEMQLSVSTIRTHLHNVYGKIGAVDRAQAVLTARDRGWI
ncbi:MAG: HDOD domain-containing protein [Solirubrobacterales bacterium]